MRRTAPTRDSPAQKSPEAAKPRPPSGGTGIATSAKPTTPRRIGSATPESKSPRDVKLANICTLLDEVERALEADKQARAALQESLLETQSVRAVLSISPADVSACSGCLGSITSDPISIDTSPFQTPSAMRTQSRASPTSGRLLDATPQQAVDAHRQLREEANGHHQGHEPGHVYNRILMEKDSKLHDVGSALEVERRRGRELEAALAEATRHAAEEKAVLLGQLTSMQEQLHKAKDDIYTFQLEREIFTTHKESLVNALKHERSLVNFAISKMEQHHLDASHLKRLQQQFAVDTIGGTFVSTSFSVPPALGGVVAAESTPEQRQLEEQVGRPIPNSVREPSVPKVGLAPARGGEREA